ncbi:hypothetical protein EBB07_03475 [Paenibacillaceae bacterium]|nr:hypothetical protein EBB07_03475 [Paenibacillaceae bacterium]
MSKKKVFLLSLAILLIASVIAGFSYADSSKINFLTDDDLDPARALEEYYKEYAETPLIMDSSREIKMFEITDEELLASIEELYNDPSHVIGEASLGKGIDYTEYVVNAAPLPYYFNFDFKANLTSQRIDNPNSGTVRITANGSWGDDSRVGSDFNYFDITLHSVGNGAIATGRFRVGNWRHYDFPNVPAGEMFFTMQKHELTWQDGGISGSGAVVQP